MREGGQSWILHFVAELGIDRVPTTGFPGQQAFWGRAAEAGVLQACYTAASVPSSGSQSKKKTTTEGPSRHFTRRGPQFALN